jgi:superfamily II DNA/RNA helicase
LNFTEFGFEPELMEGIDGSGYTTATPVQQQVIPIILNHKDLIASAQTGTGKTAAFLLPLIQLLMKHKQEHHISAVIIVPTRELAIQIAQHMEGLSYFTDVSFISVFGGGDGGAFVDEKRALTKGVDLVICTPGKMISHLNMGYVKFSHVKYLILDEADRMLDMGFHEDILKIINHTPATRQTLLFSATMPERIRALARKILKQPEEINIALSKPPERIIQEAFIVYEPQKNPLIIYLLKKYNFKSVIVFCSRKHMVKQLTSELKRAGFKVDEMHSDLEQAQREQVINDFKSKKLPLLIATDIVSRGIDIEDIDLVINYDVPNDGEDYVHRIGRTARASSSGMAFTLVVEKEQTRFSEIEELIGYPVTKTPIPESLGEAPLYEPKKKKVFAKPRRNFKPKKK